MEFERAVQVLAGTGHRVFVEVSPHPVLTAAISATLEDRRHPAVVTGTLRRDDGGSARLLASLAEVHVRGADVDWAAVLPAAERVDLPTYAFQHQRYWPARAPARRGRRGRGQRRRGAGSGRRSTAATCTALAGALAVDERQPFSEVLPALAAWRRRELDRSAIAAWRYRIAGEPVADPGPAARLSGTWLVLAPRPSGPEPPTPTAWPRGRALRPLTARVPAWSSPGGLGDRGRPRRCPGRDRPPVLRPTALGSRGSPGATSSPGRRRVRGPTAGRCAVAAGARRDPGCRNPGGTRPGLAATLALIQALGDAEVQRRCGW